MTTEGPGWVAHQTASGWQAGTVTSWSGAYALAVGDEEGCGSFEAVA